MEECKYVFVTYDLGQTPWTGLTGSSGKAVRIDCSLGEERGDGGVVAIPFGLALFFLFLSLRILRSLGGFLYAPRHCSECFPDHGTSTKGPAGVFASQGDKGIGTPATPCLGIGQAENVCDGVACDGVAEAEWSIRHAARQKLAGQGSNNGGSKGGKVGRVIRVS